MLPGGAGGRLGCWERGAGALDSAATSGCCGAVMATKTIAMSAAGTICCEHGSCFDSWQGGGAAFWAPHAATHQALARASHSDNRIRVTITPFS